MRVVKPDRWGLSALALVAGAISTPAWAVQDTPTTINGIETVCTGVGSSQDDPRWPAYPVKLVFSNGGAQFVAGTQVELSRGGKQLMATVCDAPWVLLRLPAGSYTVTATLAGGTGTPHSANFTTTGSGPQQNVGISFTRLPPNQ